MQLDLSNVDFPEERFGVVMQICVFTAMSRGEFDAKRGWLTSPSADVAGWEVSPMHASKEVGNSFFLTREEATACTAPIEGVSLRLERPEDQVLHAERAVYVQRVLELKAEIQQRLLRASQNGSFDTYAETTLTKRLELLIALVDNCDERLASD